jgi:hypothetical protein
MHDEVLALAAQVQARVGDAVDRNGAGVGPRDDREDGEDAVEVDAARCHQPVGEQVQAKVGVGGVRRRRLQVLDHGEDRAHGDPPARIGVDAGIEVGDVGRVGAECGLGVPHVEHGVPGEGGKSQPGRPSRDGRSGSSISRHTATVAT